MSGKNASLQPGIDSFTAGLLLRTASSGDEESSVVAADLYKALKSEKTAPAHHIAQSHAILKKLGYVPGAIVELNYGMGAIGKIIDYRTNAGGLYDGLRYPVTVQGPGGTYEQSIFNTHYKDLPKYKDNPQKLVELYADELGLKLVNDIDNPQEVMFAQAELSKKKHIYDLIEFLDTYEKPLGDKVDYVFKYALACLENQWRNELNLTKKAAEFIESKDFGAIKSIEAKKILEDMYYSRLSFFNEFYNSFGIPHNELLSIYKYATGDHKDKVRKILIDRCAKLEDNELYDFASIVKGSDIEQEVLSKLESRMQ